jgi:hypothetical protein
MGDQPSESPCVFAGSPPLPTDKDTLTDLRRAVESMIKSARAKEMLAADFASRLEREHENLRDNQRIGDDLSLISPHLGSLVSDARPLLEIDLVAPYLSDDERQALVDLGRLQEALIVRVTALQHGFPSTPEGKRLAFDVRHRLQESGNPLPASLKLEDGVETVAGWLAVRSDELIINGTSRLVRSMGRAIDALSSLRRRVVDRLDSLPTAVSFEVAKECHRESMPVCPDEAWLSPADISKQFPGTSPESVRKKLARWRNANRSRRDAWKEVRDRSSKDAHHIFLFGAVKHLFQASGEASGEKNI